jgi:hypothetical protein
LQACAHPFFNELREGNKVLPNGRDFPQLFNFTEQGKSLLEVSPHSSNTLPPPSRISNTTNIER